MKTENAIAKILASDATKSLKISKLQNLALRTFPSSPAGVGVMAKPNRVMAYLPKRSPVEAIRCKSLSEAQRVAEQKRVDGFDAKATSRKYGSRRNPSREFTCFVYERLAR